MNGAVLPGGGARGSWQAGAMLYVAETNQFPAGFDFYGCTSVGGVNGIGYAMFPPERFIEGAKFAVELWDTRVRSNADIYRHRWPLGIPGAWNPSLSLADPLAALLDDVVDLDAVAQSGVQLRLTATDLLTGTLKVYTESDLTRLGLAPVMATSSFPTQFPPVPIDDRYETDGGVRDIAPLGAAIAAGCTRIIALPTRNPQAVEVLERSHFDRFPGALHVATRVIDLQSHEILSNDLRLCDRINKWLAEGWLSPESGMKPIDLDVIWPSSPLGDPLDFNGDLMKRQVAQGYEDAAAYYNQAA